MSLKGADADDLKFSARFRWPGRWFTVYVVAPISGAWTGGAIHHWLLAPHYEATATKP